MNGKNFPEESSETDPTLAGIVATYDKIFAASDDKAKAAAAKVQERTLIVDAFEQLKTTRYRLYDATELVIRAKTALEHDRNDIIANIDPKLLGSNEAQRNAVLEQKTSARVAGVEQAEARQREAQLLHDIARMNVREIELLLDKQRSNG